MLRVIAQEPQKLLDAIYQAIEDGTVTTWQSTSNGSFTHTTPSDQWKNKAWFRPSVDDKGITFNIIRPKGGRVTKEVYAVYHGRFSEMLLAHFDNRLTVIRLPALADDNDIV